MQVYEKILQFAQRDSVGCKFAGELILQLLECFRFSERLKNHELFGVENMILQADGFFDDPVGNAAIGHGGP